MPPNRHSLSFDMIGGVKTASLVQAALDLYPGTRELVLVIKQFLTQRGCNEVFTGGLSSYAVTLLVLSFFQVLFLLFFFPPASHTSTIPLPAGCTCADDDVPHPLWIILRGLWCS